MSDALTLLKGRGFLPDLVIDVGANKGQWTTISRKLFPSARYHLIEPQTGCHAALRALAQGVPNLVVHEVAATRSGVPTVVMQGGGANHDDQGNYIPIPGTVVEGALSHPAAALDDLLSGDLERSNHVLAKFDVEGHELEALAGATRMLECTEVLVAEFTIFKVWDFEQPTFTDLVIWLDAHGFALYDFASLRGRKRDNRLFLGDAIFVRKGSPLLADSAWS